MYHRSLLSGPQSAQRQFLRTTVVQFSQSSNGVDWVRSVPVTLFLRVASTQEMSSVFK